MDATHAPLSTANVLAYVNVGFYNGMVLHRVVPGYVVQGGGCVDSSGTCSLKPTGAHQRGHRPGKPQWPEQHSWAWPAPATPTVVPLVILTAVQTQ